MEDEVHVWSMSVGIRVRVWQGTLAFILKEVRFFNHCERGSIFLIIVKEVLFFYIYLFIYCFTMI